MGSFSILNNITAVTGQHMLNLNNVNLNRTLTRLSSGSRINTGADDAAGLQIADTLRANVRALDQAIRNAGDGISFLQIADGALQEMTNMLTRAVTLAEQAANEPIDAAGRRALDNEFQEIQAEIARTALQTNFNGTKIFAEGRAFQDLLDLFVGDLSGDSFIRVNIGYIRVDETGRNYQQDLGLAAGGTAAGNPNGNVITEPPDGAISAKVIGFGVAGSTSGSLSTVHLLTHGKAAAALASIREALNAISVMRGTIGAGMNRLQAGIAVMQTQSRNTLTAESSIRDANMAEEITNMTKFQILAQTGIAALAHSNANSQTVLRLLQ